MLFMPCQYVGARLVRRMRHTAQEETARIAVRSNTLQQRQGIADTVASRGCELRRVEERVY